MNYEDHQYHKRLLNYFEKYKQLCEALVGIDAIERYTQEEIVDYAYKLKDIEEKFYDSKKT